MRFRTVLVALCALGILIAIALAGTPAGHSKDFNLSWFSQFDEQFWRGVLYPRHLPGLWFGLGGLDFFFYGPIPFWVASLLGEAVCLGCGTNSTFAAGGAWLLAISGLAFYSLSSRLFRRRTAIITSLVYVILPYHLLINWFIRQSVGEVSAYIFIPLLAYGFIAIVEGSRKTPVFAFALAGLILSHLPTALLAGHVFAVVFVVWAWIERHDFTKLLGALTGMAFWGSIGLGLAAFYWLPAVILLKDVSPEALYGSYFDPMNWLYLSPGAQPVRGLFRLILISLLSSAFVVVAALYLGALGARWVRLLIAVPFFTAAILMTGISRPIWEIWVISRVQFPWRLMIFVDFSTAIAVGVLVSAAFDNRRSNRIISVIGLCALVGSFVAASPTALKTGVRGYRSIQNDIPLIGATEYLPPDFFGHFQSTQQSEGRPVWAVRDIGERLAEAAREEAAGTQVLTRASRYIRVGSDTQASDLHVPLPYWRHFAAKSVKRDVEIELRPDPDSGMTIVSPWEPGDEVEIALPLHWSEKYGYTITVLSIFLIPLAYWCRRKISKTG